MTWHEPPYPLHPSKAPAKPGGKGLATSPLGSRSRAGRHSRHCKDQAERWGTGGEGTPTRRPVPWAARDRCRSRRGVCDPLQRRMGPPARSARSPLWKPLCRNGTGALRFVGTLLTFSQPTAPIHRALPFLNYSAVAASGGQRQSQRGYHCTEGDRQTHSDPCSPCTITSGPTVPLPPPELDKEALGKHGAVPPHLPAPLTGVPLIPTPGPRSGPWEPHWRGRGGLEFAASALTHHARGKHDSSLPKLNKDSPHECGWSEPTIQQGEKEVRRTARKNTRYLQKNIFPNPRAKP